MLQPKPSRAPQPISRPPMAAAASDFSGGQGVRANGLVAAAAAIAPRIMPRSVRLEVSLRIESASARLGPGHCQNSACGEIDAEQRRELGAPDREAEGHAPGMVAGGEHGDRQKPDQDRAEHDPRRRHERRRRAGARCAMAASAADGEARPGRGEPAPGSEIGRGEDRIDAAERQERRQMQAADHAAGDEEGERDQHAPGAAAGGVERAGAAAVGELHADAEHEGADHERRPERRDGAAKARHQRRDRHDRPPPRSRSAAGRRESRRPARARSAAATTR